MSRSESTQLNQTKLDQTKPAQHKYLLTCSKCWFSSIYNKRRHTKFRISLSRWCNSKSKPQKKTDAITTTRKKNCRELNEWRLFNCVGRLQSIARSHSVLARFVCKLSKQLQIVDKVWQRMQHCALEHTLQLNWSICMVFARFWRQLYGCSTTIETERTWATLHMWNIRKWPICFMVLATKCSFSMSLHTRLKLNGRKHCQMNNDTR